MLLFTPVLLAASELPPGVLLRFDKALLINMGIQIFNIAILTLILGWFLYKPVLKYMHDRTERIRGEIQAARNERDEALALKEEYERLLTGIETERELVLHQAHKMAMERSDQMLFDARRESEQIFERVMQELETERKNQDDEMRRQIIEISVMMAEKIIEANLDRAAHDRLLDEAIARWRES